MFCILALLCILTLLCVHRVLQNRTEMFEMDPGMVYTMRQISQILNDIDIYQKSMPQCVNPCGEAVLGIDPRDPTLYGWQLYGTEWKACSHGAPCNTTREAIGSAAENIFEAMKKALSDKRKLALCPTCVPGKSFKNTLNIADSRLFSALDDGTVCVCPDTSNTTTPWQTIIRGKNIFIGTTIQRSEQLSQQVVQPHLLEPVIRGYFDHLVSENDFKWLNTQTLVNDKPTFQLNTSAKILVDYCKRNNIKFKAHAAAWYQANPSYVKQDATLRAAVMNHVTDFCTATGGYSWKIDVVNEAIDDNGSNPGIREYWTKMSPSATGIDAIGDAFLKARQIAPNAILVYNDYGTSPINKKSDAVFAMFQKLALYNPDCVPDEVGIQYHETASQMDGKFFDSVKLNMQRFNKAFKSKLRPNGISVGFTEIDIINDLVGGTVDERLAKIGELYKKTVLVAFHDLSICNSICFWGLDSRLSYIYADYNPDKKLDIDKNPGALPFALETSASGEKKVVEYPAVNMIRQALYSIVSRDAKINPLV